MFRKKDKVIAVKARILLLFECGGQFVIEKGHKNAKSIHRTINVFCLFEFYFIFLRKTLKRND